MPIIRYKNESNSQRTSPGSPIDWRCLCQSLDTRMKAIHNASEEGQLAGVGCLCQSLDTRMKAIHNTLRRTVRFVRMFMPIIRYKNESNSQRSQRHRRVDGDVYANH